MAYGGYGGFENEAYRQSTLKGRRFIPVDKSTRVAHFHTTNVGVALDHLDTQQLPSIRGGSGIDRNKLPVAGEITRHGIPTSQYDVITGISDKERWRVMPIFGAHASRVPVHTLDAKMKHTLLNDVEVSEVESRPPQPRAAGVALGPGHKQYVNADMAMKPPGAGLLTGPNRQLAVEYSSHGSLKTDRHKHSRPVYSPQDRSVQPLTSSQEYGWKAKQMPSDRTSFNRKLCRETRFAQSLALGARHKSGYSGQGTL